MLGNLLYPVSERFKFLVSFLRAPQKVGSITPSSRYLAEAMVKHIRWEDTKVLVELGAGTGAFTQLIDERKRAETLALVFEQDPALRKLLIRKYPRLHVKANAVRLLDTLNDFGVGDGEVDAIICGLPFAVFPQTLRDEIMDKVFNALKPGGLFICFQYSLQMKKQLKQRFDVVRVSMIPLNVPPAFVYTCVKKSELDGED